MNAIPLRAPRGHLGAMVECDTVSLYERDLTKRLGKMSALSALPPPPPDYYAKKNAFSVFVEAVAVGRRTGSATGSGSAGRLHDRHYTTLLFWCAAGPSHGCIQDIWRASRPILPATRGAGETPTILKVFCIGVGNESLSAKKPSTPGGYAKNLGCTLLTGVRSKMGVSFWLSLESYTGFRNQPLWSPPNLDHTLLTARIPDHLGDSLAHWRLRPGRQVWPHLTDNQLECTHNNPGYTRRFLTAEKLPGRPGSKGHKVAN